MCLRLMGLQQAAYERKALLEQQANAAVLDYEQKRVQDEFARSGLRRSQAVPWPPAAARNGLYFIIL